MTTDDSRAPDLVERGVLLLRLRQMMVLTLVVWPAFGVLDWYVVSYLGGGRLWIYWGLRLVGLVLPAITLIRCHVSPAPSARTLVLLNDLVFTSISLLVAVMAVGEFRGIASPYATGIIIVMMAGPYVVADHWRRGLIRVALPPVTFPIACLVGTLVSPEVRAQWDDPSTRAAFVMNMFFLSGAWIVALYSGHVMWSLRRQIYESRSLGRYRLIAQIGSGGMGEVWRATDRVLGREVAVKILRPDIPARERATAVARFEREVRMTSDLRHPNTVRVFDFGTTEDDVWYYVMELLDGETLHAAVSREGPFAPARVIAIAAAAARALAEAHAKGIVHRDIKPSNVFLAKAGDLGDVVKVLDFGIARGLGAQADVTLTAVGDVVGTPAFASPEAASGEIDARSDVYSLGASLYYALTGTPPFAAATPIELLLAHSKQPLEAPSARLGRPLPAELEAIVVRCLAKPPRDRFASAAELAAALAPLAKDAPARVAEELDVTTVAMKKP